MKNNKKINESDSDKDMDIENKSNISHISIKSNKHQKYKPRDPLYLYYIINGKEYKYI